MQTAWDANIERKAEAPAQQPAALDNGAEEQVFQTEEGPVVITARGNMVFISESFPSTWRKN